MVAFHHYYSSENAILLCGACYLMTLTCMACTHSNTPHLPCKQLRSCSSQITFQLVSSYFVRKYKNNAKKKSHHFVGVCRLMFSPDFLLVAVMSLDEGALYLYCVQFSKLYFSQLSGGVFSEACKLPHDML